jgi:hypothetical protein
VEFFVAFFKLRLCRTKGLFGDIISGVADPATGTAAINIVAVVIAIRIKFLML